MLPWKIRPFAGASAVGFWGTIIGALALAWRAFANSVWNIVVAWALVRFDLLAFIRRFWVSPRRYPDLA